MSVTWKHREFLEKSGLNHMLTARFTMCDLNKLSEEAIEKRKFSIIPILKFVLKVEIRSECIVKEIEKDDDASNMASNISNHLKYLQELGTREQHLRAVKIMGAELVRAAIEEEKLHIAEIFLESLEIEKGVIDISDLMERKRVCYKPKLLSKLLEKGASLEIYMQTKSPGGGIRSIIHQLGCET